MKLRQLEVEDAPLMLEWMHDPSVVEYMQADFAGKTLEDCEAFIKSAQKMNESMHLAIADDNDQYQGTVSLKYIRDGSAEFAITIRASAMGRGISRYAMKEIIRKGFDELELRCIYWCVDPANKRAVRFYDKNGFRRVEADILPVLGAYTEEQILSYIWYCEKAEG